MGSTDCWWWFSVFLSWDCGLSVMALKSLPPGFRFHPTDVELVLYYLKRKIMGKKLHYEAIAEVNIYKFSPWDLPGQLFLFFWLFVFNSYRLSTILALYLK